MRTTRFVSALARQLARFFALGLGIGVGLAVCLGAFQRSASFETVEAKRFHVVDGQGKLVADFGLTNEKSDPALVFYDREGERIALFLATKGFPALVLFGPEDSAAILRFDGTGPHLLIRDRQGNALGRVPSRQ